MKTRVAVAVKKPDRDATKKRSPQPPRLKKLVALGVLLPFVVGMVVLWWWSTGLQQQQLEAAALAQAQAYVQALRETGSIYAADSGNHAKANFSVLLTKSADGVKTQETAITRRLHFKESAPGQGKNNEAASEFIQGAWTTLSANPGQDSWRFEDRHGQPTLHYATEWKEGETKGIIELLVPMDRLESSFSQYRLMLLGLGGVVGLLSLGWLMFSQRTVRQEAWEAKSRFLILERDHLEQEKRLLTYAREQQERKQEETIVYSITDMLATVTSDLLQVTTELASGAAEMAAGVNQTTATGEEVQRTAALSHQKAQDVAAAAQHAAQVAQAGKQATEDTTKEMQRIRDQMRSITESTVQLSEQGQTVREIIDTVNDLAEQSNVLAINAAIEAQKAGVHGNGFVIVAQEVRSLAQQSKDATAQVREILNDIENATSSAVQITTQGEKAAEAGTQQAIEAGEAIRLLFQSAQESAQSAAQIAASSQQQMLGIEQLVRAMHSMQDSSAQTMTNAQQVEHCVQRLQELDQRLRALSEQLGGDASVHATPPEQAELAKAA